MSLLALAEPSTGAYTIEFAPAAMLALMRMPVETAALIRKRLQEIAVIAGDLRSVLLDGLASTLRLEVGGQIVSYVVSDVQRTLTVLSVVPEAE